MPQFEIVLFTSFAVMQGGQACLTEAGRQSRTKPALAGERVSQAQPAPTIMSKSPGQASLTALQSGKP
ncbi:MAG: hypothetical protein AB7F88_04695 [Pyrinomonadaceae bacterium]